MKVVIVNKHRMDALGGSEVQCDILAERFAAAGHDVTYLAMAGLRSAYDVSYAIRPVRAPKFRILWREFRKARPDVVYWRYGKRGLMAGALSARLSGAVFVYSLSHVADGLPWRDTYGTSPFRLEGISPRALVRWGRTLLSTIRQVVDYLAIPLFADMVLSNNRNFLDGVPCARKDVIHNSMRTQAVPFEWPRPFVAWVANIKSRKRPEDFFRLAAELKHLDVDFVMVGAMQDPAYSEKLAEWMQAPNFHYLGAKSLEEVNGILGASLFLVHTCEPEGFPNNCIQAWLLGKPVVSLRFDPEGVLQTEGAGLYSQTFANFVRDTEILLRDAGLREETGRRAREYALREFDADTNVARLESILLDLVNGKRGRPDLPRQEGKNG